MYSIKNGNDACPCCKAPLMEDFNVFHFNSHKYSIYVLRKHIYWSGVHQSIPKHQVKQLQQVFGSNHVLIEHEHKAVKYITIKLDPCKDLTILHFVPLLIDAFRGETTIRINKNFKPWKTVSSRDYLFEHFIDCAIKELQ